MGWAHIELVAMQGQLARSATASFVTLLGSFGNERVKLTAAAWYTHYWDCRIDDACFTSSVVVFSSCSAA